MRDMYGVWFQVMTCVLGGQGRWQEMRFCSDWRSGKELSQIVTFFEEKKKE